MADSMLEAMRKAGLVAAEKKGPAPAESTMPRRGPGALGVLIAALAMGDPLHLDRCFRCGAEGEGYATIPPEALRAALNLHRQDEAESKEVRDYADRVLTALEIGVEFKLCPGCVLAIVSKREG